MARSLGFLALGVFAVFPAGPSLALEQSPPAELSLSSSDRVLILAPHPDDEVLGCGGIIQKAVELKLPGRVVFLTYGDSNELAFILYRGHPVLMPKAVEAMGEIRHREALAAGKILGLRPDQLTFLGYPDLGTFPIWCSHWRDQPAYRSVLTRVTAVPYRDAFRPGAAYKGEEILRDLETILSEFQPTKVFVTHASDAHPDHRAWYLFARVALWDFESEVRADLYPYLVHYKGWPALSRSPMSDVLRPPDSLPQTVWREHLLSPEEAGIKLKALKAHKSQYESSPRSLASLVRLNELFGESAAIPIRPGVPSADLSQKNLESFPEALEGLTDEEQAAFVGGEWRYAQRDGENLVLSFRFSRALARGVALSVYVFGYRKDHRFERMPKLHLRIGVLHHEVYDQNDPLPSSLIQVSREPQQITVRVPLELLGNPHAILASAQTALADGALDLTSWRVLDLSQ